MGPRIVIIGGVAAGATAAARARRLSNEAAITLVERGPHISYANCGLPYFIGGDIEERSALLLQTPEGFAHKYRVDVRVNTEVVEIDREQRRILLRSAAGDSWLPYDQLVLAQGGNPIMPAIPGIDAPGVFKLWTLPDMDRLHAELLARTPRTAVIVGGGFIGIEMAEAFVNRGLATTVIELLPTVMSTMDPEFGGLVGAELASHGVRLETGVGVVAVHGDTREVELSDGRRLAADVVLFSVGVRPELELARRAGLAIGASGGLLVDENLATSDPRIHAAGDMVEVEHRVSGRRVRVPLAGPANRQGRVAASNALGHPMRYGGVLGTSIVKVFEATAGATGLSEKAARAAGFDVGVAVMHKDHHAAYYPGAREMTLKLVYERPTGRLLGAQAFGHAGIESRLNVAAAALHARQTVADLAELDLVYAPPYSSANDPINLAAFVAENDLSGFSPLVTADDLAGRLREGAPPLLLDVRSDQEFRHGHLRGARHIALDELPSRLSELPPDRRIVVYCRAGYRGHIALRTLRGAGWGEVFNVTGGWVSLVQHGGFETERGEP
jgi:NADPH-dependent 2,4-dienoyl-CoA reductase/sulfur reductase-like enzyme/rhodanese-related sulfurtransferase